VAAAGLAGAFAFFLAASSASFFLLLYVVPGGSSMLTVGLLLVMVFKVVCDRWRKSVRMCLLDRSTGRKRAGFESR